MKKQDQCRAYRHGPGPTGYRPGQAERIRHGNEPREIPPVRMAALPERAEVIGERGEEGAARDGREEIVGRLLQEILRPHPLEDVAVSNEVAVRPEDRDWPGSCFWFLPDSTARH